MAVTKIKQIYVTVGKAAEYIASDIKTDNGRLTEYYNCGQNPIEAAANFELTRQSGSGKSKILAQHVFQSFVPSEVTPEQAFEIGRELAENLLKGEYQYVLTTHIDKEHTHNHLIFCNTNMMNLKTFETNENRGKTSWKRVRQLSDELCKKYKLSVLEATQLSGERGQGHYEWEQNSGGSSWKSRLKTLINAVVSESKNLDDFLAKMQAAGVECEYKPDNKIKLKYKLPGQQKFTRARTLGSPYDVEGIGERIERNKLYLDGANISSSGIRLINTDTDKIRKSEGLTAWARARNMKTAADIMVALEKKGIHNLDELDSKIEAGTSKRKQHIEARNTLKTELTQVEFILENVEKYRAGKAVYNELNELNSKTFGKRKAEAFEIEHSGELAVYEQARAALQTFKFEGNKLPKVNLLKEKIEQLRADITEYDDKIKTATNTVSELKSMKSALNEYLGQPEKAQEKKKGRPERGAAHDSEDRDAADEGDGR